MNRINKEYKSIDERINILKSRGLLFKNETAAYNILLKHSYFDIINANEKLFADMSFSEKHYLPNIYFEDLYDIYLFNNELSELTMNILLSVEATLKNSLSYRFCGRYCTSIFNTEEYINPNNFVRPQQRALLQKWNRFWPFSNHRDYIASLKRKYNYMDVYDKLPFWVAIKGIDFGTTAQYIRFLDRTTKAEVKNDLGFQNFSENTFEHAIYMLKEMRNSCAHGEMIYRFSRNPNSSTFNYHLTAQELGLSRTSVNYMDIIKILKLLVSKKEIQKVKRCIIRFYIKYVFKRKTWMVKKILGKMGNQNIKKWIKL
mgnify:CR=1 FL=1